MCRLYNFFEARVVKKFKLLNTEKTFFVNNVEMCRRVLVFIFFLF